jgi:hypothetical protein
LWSTRVQAFEDNISKRYNTNGGKKSKMLPEDFSEQTKKNLGMNVQSVYDAFAFQACRQNYCYKRLGFCICASSAGYGIDRFLYLHQ